MREYELAKQQMAKEIRDADNARLLQSVTYRPMKKRMIMVLIRFLLQRYRTILRL